MSKQTMRRSGDDILVLVHAGDGPVYVPHTPEERATFLRGVDMEASVMIDRWTTSMDAGSSRPVTDST